MNDCHAGDVSLTRTEIVCLFSVLFCKNLSVYADLACSELGNCTGNKFLCTMFIC